MAGTEEHQDKTEVLQMEEWRCGEKLPGQAVRVSAVAEELFRSIRREYPEDYDCSQQAVAYLAKNWGWNCSRDEQLYLILHIHRVRVTPTETEQ